jgi:hypothetical protein
MRRRLLPAALLQVGLGLIVAVAALLPVPDRVAPLEAGTEVVPDLAMAPLDDFTIQWVNGRRMLRFTAMMVNIGSGQFEVRGSRASTSQPMRVSQVIFTSPNRATIARTVPTDAVGQWSGDGHDHWHVQEMMRYDLWGEAGTYRGAKVGFCFLDSDPWNLGLPGASGTPFYRGSWCANSPSALSNRMGISIGWGDEYEYYLAYQWVDITGMPAGNYWVRAKVDPYGFFLEENEGNQCGYARISWTGQSNAVTVAGRGLTCPNDWSASPFAAHIAWAFDHEITLGCAPELFCTNNPVSREQMASFLVRALGLPPATADYFTDDARSTHQADINSVAEAGITQGCGGARYCPRAGVTRAEMASFLARAYALPPPTTDHFTDDDGSLHEPAINSVADAGITLGCGGTEYCPNEVVTRGQMAAFLHRAAVL